MFDKRFITNAINRSAETSLDRRKFFAAAGVAGVGAGVTALASGTAASAATAAASPVSDATVLNFALNLEYLEAEFYLHAVYGTGLPSSQTDGSGTLGGVTGGRAVPWKDANLKSIATEIANDERAHVNFLRTALAGSKVSRPAIDLKSSFTAAAMAAGLIKAGQTFDPFASQENFLLGAFIFEDVGVTAYKGAAPLITNSTYLSAAAGILSVEAYHAGIIRTSLLNLGLAVPADKIAVARDRLDGTGRFEYGPTTNHVIDLVPTDSNGIVFGRTPARVLNIAYLTPNAATKGGFFPAGVNGDINASGAPGDPTA
ncbi:hypothetical protein AS850_11485 [Frondihabitans sp. 762G35]|uniref:ferritin-like domain-containing protein n=1 Tax=Frondihabitans sp. 762G35 TaxID=1446794 RepID=UPI000D21E5BC|nr:ferritin-like domain-containing protein [Frondihabitans sp. 762G35]ARC57694.1 hypothetical protein AS850_11485 [Frondihabitans sp. 762G35]